MTDQLKHEDTSDAEVFDPECGDKLADLVFEDCQGNGIPGVALEYWANICGLATRYYWSPPGIVRQRLQGDDNLIRPCNVKSCPYKLDVYDDNWAECPHAPTFTEAEGRATFRAALVYLVMEVEWTIGNVKEGRGDKRQRTLVATAEG